MQISMQNYRLNAFKCYFWRMECSALLQNLNIIVYHTKHSSYDYLFLIMLVILPYFIQS